MVDSLKPEELGPLQLSKKLLKKHQAFIESYQREFYIRRKISVMNEKKDLIDHWISSAEEDDSKGCEKYLKKKESVDSEILTLRDELQGIIPQNSNNESEDRYSFLEEVKWHAFIVIPESVHTAPAPDNTNLNISRRHRWRSRSALNFFWETPFIARWKNYIR